jgi:glucose-6-phosphate-specific signal transduction histidine kinase
VTVTVDVTDGSLVFAVADEGPGFDPGAATAAGGIGLTGMVDRVAAVDGILTLDAAPGQGCRVTGRIPIGLADGTPELVVYSAGRPGAGTIVAGARSGEPG